MEKILEYQSSFLALLSQSKGRDKVCKMIQYTSRTYAEVAEEPRRRGYLAVAKSMSNGRKIFRLFRFLEELERMYITWTGPKSHYISRAIESGVHICAFNYYLLDHLLFFSSVGFLTKLRDKKKRIVKGLRDANSFSRLVFAILLNVIQLQNSYQCEYALMKQQANIASRKNNMASTLKATSLSRDIRDLRRSRRMIVMDTVQNIADMAICTDSLNFWSGNPFYLGLLGMLSALIGLLKSSKHASKRASLIKAKYGPPLPKLRSGSASAELIHLEMRKSLPTVTVPRMAIPNGIAVSPDSNPVTFPMHHVPKSIFAEPRPASMPLNSQYPAPLSYKSRVEARSHNKAGDLDGFDLERIDNLNRSHPGLEDLAEDLLNGTEDMPPSPPTTHGSPLAASVAAAHASAAALHAESSAGPDSPAWTAAAQASVTAHAHAAAAHLEEVRGLISNLELDSPRQAPEQAKTDVDRKAGRISI